MYRVTPIFVGDELVCRGILMEAQSVEDNDCVFCVYCYNVQPGIEIDYATGNSRLAGSSDTPFPPTQQAPTQEEERTYVLNTRSKKIHTPYCSEVKNISEGNIDYAKGVSLSELIKQGYSVCKKCSPQ